MSIRDFSTNEIFISWFLVQKAYCSYSISRIYITGSFSKILQRLHLIHNTPQSTDFLCRWVWDCFHFRCTETTIMPFIESNDRSFDRISACQYSSFFQKMHCFFNLRKTGNKVFLDNSEIESIKEFHGSIAISKGLATIKVRHSPNWYWIKDFRLYNKSIQNSVFKIIKQRLV